MQNIIYMTSSAENPGTNQHKTAIRIAPIINASHTFI